MKILKLQIGSETCWNIPALKMICQKKEFILWFEQEPKTENDAHLHTNRAFCIEVLLYLYSYCLAQTEYFDPGCFTLHSNWMPSILIKFLYYWDYQVCSA